MSYVSGCIAHGLIRRTPVANAEPSSTPCLQICVNVMATDILLILSSNGRYYDRAQNSRPENGSGGRPDMGVHSLLVKG